MLFLTQTYEICIILLIWNSKARLGWAEGLGQNSNPTLYAAKVSPDPHVCRNCRDFGWVPYLLD